ncbi:MAG: STAS domain-containing protein [Candidatus Acidiferrales bacterium]|jgi:anti-sigma B factor antagonist
MMLSKKQIKPGVWVLEMSGRVNMGADCTRIDKEVNHHIDHHENSIIFDMAAVDHIDSAVIGQIVKSFSRLKKSGGTLRLAALSPMVEGVLTMTQVNKVISIYPTVAAASEGLPKHS